MMEVDKTLKVSDHDVWTNDFMRGDKTYLGREPWRRAVERWCQQHDSQCETERQERPHRAASALWRALFLLLVHKKLTEETPICEFPKIAFLERSSLFLGLHI